MRSLNSLNGSRVGDSLKSRPTPSGAHAFVFTPLGMYRKARRTGMAALAPAVVAAGIIASSHGRARLAPAPRRTVLREILILSPFSPLYKSVWPPRPP